MFSEQQEREIIERTITFCPGTLRENLSATFARYADARHWFAVALVAVATRNEEGVQSAIAAAAASGVAADLLYAVLGAFEQHEHTRIEEVLVEFGWSRMEHELQLELQRARAFSDPAEERRVLVKTAGLLGELPKQNRF